HCHSLNEETKQKQSQYLSAYRFKNSAIPFSKEIKNSILIPTNISILHNIEIVMLFTETKYLDYKFPEPQKSFLCI
ncbi:hypothetical protein, partial [Bacteroides heparinolyticus]